MPFYEAYVEADGFRIRYLEAGQGPALLHLHGAGGVRLSPAHDLLAEKFRVIAVEMPGFGGSAENTRTRDLPRQRTMATALLEASDARYRCRPAWSKWPYATVDGRSPASGPPRPGARLTAT